MISRLKIILKETPKWQDIIEIKTYATDISGYFAYRNFEIIKEEKIIGNSTFLWLIKDKIKNRLIKSENFIKKFPINHIERFFDLKEKIPEISEKKDTGEKIKVKYSDIDINNHVNNAKYLQWVIDSVDKNILIGKCLKEIEINFFLESFLGEELKIFKIVSKDNNFIFSIKNDEKEKARIKLKF